MDRTWAVRCVAVRRGERRVEVRKNAGETIYKWFIYGYG